MDNSAATTLQQYAPGMFKVLADIVLTTFLFGCLTVLSIVSVCHLIRRGIKQPSTAFMLGSVFLLYASTATHFAAKTTYVVAYSRLFNAAVAALEPTPPLSTDVAFAQFGEKARTISYIISAVIATNITLGDVIVWWRVSVLWRKRSVITLGIALIVGTFVFGTMSAIHYQVDVTVQPLLSYGDMYGGVSSILSLVSNVLATSLIGRKAWQHRKVLRLGPGAAGGRWNTPTMRVLALLVESGAIYSILLFVAVVNNTMLRFKSHLPSSALEYLSLFTVFLTGCFAPILAIYPTLIIFIVALNWSQIDGPLANGGTPSDISTNMLPSLLFRSSATTTHLPPGTSADQSSDIGHAFDSPADQSGEVEQSQPQQKLEEDPHLLL
ncbi:hypothetical protein GSI_11857 [Ganoderma sinense ZZ0214-1]|uniref:Uncharacterized protein n=1 Tax=Ganoderma sinense ZZ0214-1 TaxID=1077348 RepID=A0A2G8RX56_9APHY|nr:hypothetical protein GSI_11857 [Ganoderma sinense ZZ0214-1]